MDIRRRDVNIHNIIIISTFCIYGDELHNFIYTGTTLSPKTRCLEKVNAPVGDVVRASAVAALRDEAPVDGRVGQQGVAVAVT